MIKGGGGSGVRVDVNRDECVRRIEVFVKINIKFIFFFFFFFWGGGSGRWRGGLVGGGQGR